MAQHSQVIINDVRHLLGGTLLLVVSMGAVIVPLLLVLGRGLAWPDAATIAYILTVWRATMWQAALSTGVVVFLAVPCAWAILRAPGWLSTLLSVLSGIPFVIPTPVVATMFAALCARDSWCAAVFQLEVPQGLFMVVLVHAWYNTGILVRLLVEAWHAIQGRYTAAAAVLGASAWRRFITIEWPLLRPAFISGTSLVFLYCVGSFGVVLLLGGGRVPSLEVETWRQTSQLLRLDVAAMLAVMQLVMSFVLLTLADHWRMRAEFTHPVMPWRVPPNRTTSLAHAVLGAGIVCVIAPFAISMWQLLQVQDWTTIGTLLTQPVRGSGLLMSPLDALVRSFAIACLVTCVTLVLAWLASGTSKVIQLLIMIPVGMSAVTLGLGYILWFGRLGVLTAWWVVVVAHVVLALPLVMRMLINARQLLTTRYAWAAATLGASPWRRWYSIDVPLLRRALIASALFGFAVSLGDFAASLLLTRPDAVTAPVYIARLLGRPGAQNFQLAQLVSMLLAGMCLLVMTMAVKTQHAADVDAHTHHA